MELCLVLVESFLLLQSFTSLYEHVLERLGDRSGIHWELFGKTPMCEGHCNIVVTNMKRLEGESSCSATIWGDSRRGTPSCFLNPSWMLLFNTTNKTQKYPKLQTIPLLDEVNKSSWDETSGYSVWKRPLILGLTLLLTCLFYIWQSLAFYEI